MNLPFVFLPVSAALVLSLGSAVEASAQSSWFVSTCGDDSWTGSSSTCVGPLGPKATIQAGIDAAQDGDTLWLADGVYQGPGNVNLDYFGKAIAVRSESDDPASCVIDCEETPATRGLWFHNGETSSSILRGITIRNGRNYGIGGAAILLESASPLIERCRFENNTSLLFFTGVGGAVTSQNGKPTFRDCVFEGNLAHGLTNSGRGGAMYLDGGQVLRSRFEANQSFSAGNGGALGGALFLAADEALSGVPIVVDSCLFVDNDCDVAAPRESLGAGIYVAGSAVVTGSTFEGNRAKDYDSTNLQGGAVLNDGELVLDHCILWNNNPDSLHELNGSTSVSYCNIEGGWTGTGNLDQDPVFQADYSLSNASPCIDAGSPGEVADESLDLSGASRFQDGDLDGVVRHDMGALEFTNVVLDAFPVSGVLVVDLDAVDSMAVLLLAGTESTAIALWPYGVIQIHLGAPTAILPLGVGSSTTRFLLPPGGSGLSILLQAVGVASQGRGNISGLVNVELP